MILSKLEKILVMCNEQESLENKVLNARAKYELFNALLTGFEARYSVRLGVFYIGDKLRDSHDHLKHIDDIMDMYESELGAGSIILDKEDPMYIGIGEYTDLANAKDAMMKVVGDLHKERLNVMTLKYERDEQAKRDAHVKLEAQDPVFSASADVREQSNVQRPSVPIAVVNPILRDDT